MKKLKRNTILKIIVVLQLFLAVLAFYTCMFCN